MEPPVADDGREGGSPAAHTAARAAVVGRWLIGGQTTGEARRRAMEEWDISERTAHRLLAMAREQIRSDWEIERPELLALLLSRLDRVFGEAMAAGNHGVALGAVNAAARLAQLV